MSLERCRAAHQSLSFNLFHGHVSANCGCPESSSTQNEGSLDSRNNEYASIL